MTYSEFFSDDNRDGANHTDGLHPSFEALSSWRADGLAPDEERSVQTHVSECAQCQGIVADFATVEQALRRFEPSAALLAKVSGLDARQLVSVGISDRRNAILTRDSVDDHTTAEDDESDDMTRTRLDGAPVRARSRRPGRRPLLGGALALVAVLALSVGFLAVFHVAPPKGPSNGVTTIVSGKLTWRKTILPPGVSTGSSAPFPIRSMAQSNISYLLVNTPAQVAGMWVSYDFTQHWKRLPLPPVSADAGTPTVVTDDNDAYKVVVVYTPPAHPHATTQPMEQQWVMLDTRATTPVWRQAASLPYEVTYFTLASWRTHTYELYSTSPNDGEALVSTDEMRTFTPLATPIPPSQVIGFWVQQTTGQLLIEGKPIAPPTIEGRPTTPTNTQPKLWLRSLADGRWAQINIPYYTLLPNEGPAASAPNPTTQPKGVTVDTSYYVEQPTIGTTFSICASNIGQQSPSGIIDTAKQKTSYACSWDSGKHWQRRPQTIAPCRGTPDCTNGLDLQPLIITPTGETLALAEGNIAVFEEIFLLPKNATSENAWEDIGALPALGYQGLNFILMKAGDHAVIWFVDLYQTLYYAVIP